jgi:ABC-type uncharacterized transport system YnjBCD substrate-binding protein
MRFTAFVILSLFLQFSNGQAWAQEDLIAQAKKEQELVIYGTAQAHQVQNYLKNFRKQYPFLQVKYSRATGETLTSKILAEASGGQLSADVVIINNYTQRILMKKNMLTPHLAPAIKNFPQSLANPEGYWIGLYLVPYAIEYNTKNGGQERCAQVLRGSPPAAMERSNVAGKRGISGDASARSISR